LQVLASPALANYINLVLNTSNQIADPPDFIARAKAQHPQIIAMWHGQFLLLPGIYPPEIPGRAMIARHDDAEALARVIAGADMARATPEKRRPAHRCSQNAATGRAYAPAGTGTCFHPCADGPSHNHRSRRRHLTPPTYSGNLSKSCCWRCRLRVSASVSQVSAISINERL
jgi:hypothetical protein